MTPSVDLTIKRRRLGFIRSSES